MLSGGMPPERLPTTEEVPSDNWWRGISVEGAQGYDYEGIEAARGAETFNRQEYLEGLRARQLDARGEVMGVAENSSPEAIGEAWSESTLADRAAADRILSQDLIGSGDNLLQAEGTEMARAAQLNTELEASWLGNITPDSLTTGSGGVGRAAAVTERALGGFGANTQEAGILTNVENPALLGAGVVGVGLVAGGLLLAKMNNRRKNIDQALR